MTHLLDFLFKPRNPPDSQSRADLDKRLARQLKTYRIKYPQAKQEKAIPLGIIHSIVATATFSSKPKTWHVSDLVQLGFYFCLWSCKNTTCTGHHRTVQVWPLLEFVFFVGDYLLQADAPIKQFQHVN